MSPLQRAKWLFIATGVKVDAHWCRGLCDTQEGVHNDVSEAIDHHVEPEPSNEVEDEPNINDGNDCSIHHDDDLPKEDDIDNEDWKVFEIEFNTAVDNLRKVAEEKFKNKDLTFIKGIRNFTKRLGNSVTNDKILEKNLFIFGQQTHDSVVRGRKRKLSSKIPVQPASEQRRENKHEGKGESTKGRRPKRPTPDDPEKLKRLYQKKETNTNRANVKSQVSDSA